MKEENVSNSSQHADVDSNLGLGPGSTPGSGLGPSTSPSKGHIRSASHGQPACTTAGPMRSSLLKNRPNNLNIIGAIHGHQRAFSQGQIDSSTAIRKIGHHRIGSKADFILPPGHRDTSSVGSISKLSSRFNSGFFVGHSRQASRTESVYTLRRTMLPASPNFWFRFFLFVFRPTSIREETNTKSENQIISSNIVIPKHMIGLQNEDAEEEDQLPQQQQSRNQGQQNREEQQPAKQNANAQLLNKNKIRTTKYTLLSFLPKNLLEQFHRIANLYFLFIVLLNWYPPLEVFGKEIAILPIGFVLGVTAIKDLFEDWRRHQSDNRMNNTLCRVYNCKTGRYRKIAWKEVTVGDIVHLSNNETVPADILLLRSSDVNGYCYIDTGHLDGETNLKPRYVVRNLVKKQGIFDPKKFTYQIEIDPPSTKIYRFNGFLIHSSGRRIPIGTENLLLRESQIKNTNFVEGIVLYAGHETKALLNNGGPRYKCSMLEKHMNRDVFWCLFILLLLCVSSAIGFAINHSSTDVFLSFLLYIVIFQIMIPLSLYVTLETCKMLQVYHVHNDSEMFDEGEGSGVECRALNITEDLGQIQYIFSDKTGTLTENKMIFRSCTIAGNEYYQTDCEANVKLRADLFTGELKPKIFEFLVVMSICNTVVVFKHPHRDSLRSSDLIDSSPLTQAHNSSSSDPTDVLPELDEQQQSATPSPSPSPSPKIKHRKPFLLSPIVSSSVSPTNYTVAINKKFTDFSNLFSEKCRGIYRRTKSSYEKPNKMCTLLTKSLDFKPIYEAESPDELALVQTALKYGFKLLKRTHNSVKLTVPGQGPIEYKVLQVLPFDSVRKCMSIVVLDPITHEIVLFCKGADSTILNRLQTNPDSNTSKARNKIVNQVSVLANKGLRVLVFGKRVISQWEFIEWVQRHKELAMKNSRNQESMVRDNYSKLESSLELLGATGIEDKLQDGVADTLASLTSAGIVIWVLTGDKPETAINIAYSAKLFSSEMQLLQLMSCNSKQVAENLIRQYLEEINNSDNSPEKVTVNRLPISSSLFQRFQQYFFKTRRKYSKMETQKSNKALVVDGKTLTIILDKKSNLTRPFLELTKHCRSVLCCRATPLQKAYIVKVVKEELKMRTLAIGDGANDVSMLQTADIGIGISGQEGMQAVMASDFSLTKFRYLKRLLLVHGHWCYDRLVGMVQYFFYKNAGFVFLVFWFQFYCQFTGAVMIDQINLMFYNVLFTSLPPLVTGVYDQDVPAAALMTKPYLYNRGRLNKIYTSRSFWLTMLDAFYQSIAIFFTAKAAYADSDCGIWEFGNVILSACILVMSLHAAMETKSWTILNLLSLGVSILFFYFFLFVYNWMCIFTTYTDTFWVIQNQITSPDYWLVIILSTVVALMPRFFLKSLKTVFYPSDVTIELLEQKKLFKKRFM